MAQRKVSSAGPGAKTAPPGVDNFRADPLFPTVMRATPISLGMRTEPPPPTKMPREPSGSA
jgi:hypothetical protein